MSENIVIALIGAAVSLVGSASLINWRLKSLEKKVDEHNGYAQKFAESSKDLALMQKDIEFIREKMNERSSN